MILPSKKEPGAENSREQSVFQNLVSGLTRENLSMIATITAIVIILRSLAANGPFVETFVSNDIWQTAGSINNNDSLISDARYVGDKLNFLPDSAIVQFY